MSDNTVSAEVIAFQLMVQIFEKDAETVAGVIMSLPEGERGELIEMALNAQSEEQLDSAREIFNAAHGRLIEAQQ